MPAFHPIIFDKIDGVLIRDKSLKCKGAAGPSGLDAYDWRRLCTGFHRSSCDLCNSLAAVARWMSTEFVDPSGIVALGTCCLIPLDKKPGVRPIGVCEMVRRIMCKAILSVIQDDITMVAGPIQLCAGQNAGCEALLFTLCMPYLMIQALRLFFFECLQQPKPPWSCGSEKHICQLPCHFPNTCKYRI